MASGGNRASRIAANNSFMETKPKSEAVLQKQAKDMVQNTMTNVLRALMDGNEDLIPTPPMPVPARKLTGFNLSMLKPVQS